MRAFLLYDQRATKSDSQTVQYTDYIQAQPGWVFVGIYADEGISGTSLEHRKGIAVRRSWDVWSGIPVHLQVFWQMSAIVVMYWQERPLHRTF